MNQSLLMFCAPSHRNREGCPQSWLAEAKSSQSLSIKYPMTSRRVVKDIFFYSFPGWIPLFFFFVGSKSKFMTIESWSQHDLSNRTVYDYKIILPHSSLIDLMFNILYIILYNYTTSVCMVTKCGLILSERTWTPLLYFIVSQFANQICAKLLSSRKRNCSKLIEIWQDIYPYLQTNLGLKMDSFAIAAIAPTPIIALWRFRMSKALSNRWESVTQDHTCHLEIDSSKNITSACVLAKTRASKQSTTSSFTAFTNFVVTDPTVLTLNGCDDFDADLESFVFGECL